MIDEISYSQSLPGKTKGVSEATGPQRADDRLAARSASMHEESASGEVPVKVGGELTIGNADDLRALFVESLGRGPDVVIDLAEVQACDTATLQLIWSLRKTAVQRGQRVQIARLSPAIKSAAVELGLPLQELVGDFDLGQFDSAPGESSSGV